MLREDLKKLNEQLTRNLERLRVRTFKKPEKNKSRTKTMVQELANSQKKIKAYEKEIEFLEARVDQGDQLTRIQELREQLLDFNREEARLKKLLRERGKEAKIKEKELKQSLNDQSHKNRVSLT